MVLSTSTRHLQRLLDRIWSTALCASWPTKKATTRDSGLEAPTPNVEEAFTSLTMARKLTRVGFTTISHLAMAVSSLAQT
jgi:hypothetical protein